MPAIKEKWPRDSIGEPIFIQQDNARCHIDPSDIEFSQIAMKDGFCIRLINQPPNSPDLNILDLGFFNSIQSLQYKEAPKTLDDWIGGVIKAFDSFSTAKSNRIFVTLQTCMVEIMKNRGCNKYDLPHIRKDIMEREGPLPDQLKIDQDIVQDVMTVLDDAGCSADYSFC